MTELPEKINELLTFSKTYRDISIQLGEHCFFELSNKTQCTEHLEHTEGKRFLNEEKKVADRFTLEYFYSIYLLSKVLKEKVNPREFITSFKFNYLSNTNLLDIHFISFLLLNLEKVFEFDVCQWLSVDSSNNIVRQQFLESIYLFDSTSQYFFPAIVNTTIGLKSEHNYLSINTAFRKLGIQNVIVARALIEQINDNEDKAFLLIPHIYQGINEADGFEKSYDIVLTLLNGEPMFKKIIGVRCLTLLHSDRDNLIPFIESINEKFSELIGLNDINLTAEILNFYGIQIGNIPGASDKMIQILDDNPNPILFVVLSKILWLHSKSESQSEWFRSALFRLGKFDEKYLGIFTNLDMTFIGLSKTNPELIYEYFEYYILNNNPTSIEGFKNTFDFLFDSDRKLLESKITNWLNNNEYQFHIAIEKISSQIFFRRKAMLNLDVDVLNQFNNADIKFVLLKIAGYIHTKEVLENFVFSSLRKISVSPLHSSIVVEIFTKYIGYNFTGTINFLNEKKSTASEIEAKIIEAILEQQNKNSDALEELPLELRASGQRMQKLFRNWMDQITSAMADKGKFPEHSIMDFAKRISLKTGERTFIRLNNEFGPTRYTAKSGLQGISTNFEPPKGEFTDPIGQAFLRYQWRIYQREQI